MPDPAADLNVADDNSNTSALALLLAAALLTIAITIGADAITPAMMLVALAIVAAGIGVGGIRIDRVERAGMHLLAIAVGVILLGHLTILFINPPTPMPDAIVPFSFRALLIPAAAICVLMLAWRRAQRIVFPLLLLVHLAMGWWIVQAVPFTVMDVYLFQTDSAEALLAGQNPYAITFPDFSAGTSPHYAPELLRDGRLRFGFVYPPLSLLMAVPGQLLGNDVRYAHAVATTLAGALVYYGSRHRFAAPLAAAMMFAPSTFTMITQSWTEPFAVLLLAIVLFSASRIRSVLPMSLGLLLVIKQYMLPAAALSLLLIPRPWTAKRLWRWTWQAALAAAIVTLPLVLIDLPAFLHSAVRFHLNQPYRADSLAFPALVTQWTGLIPPTTILSLAAFALAQAFVLRRSTRTPAGFAAGIGFCLLAFVSMGQQAFENYYYLIISAFLAAVAFAQSADAGSRACHEPAASR